MGLFSFGNKDASSTSGRANSASGAASGRAGRRGERAERMEPGEGLRRRRRGEPADANMLDPTLPEKQRARRRLIGAIALVLAAVVILPMVLDSHPKPATDGIAIEIPAHDDSPAPAAPAQSSTTAYEAAAGGDRDDSADSAAPPDSNKSAAANSGTANGSQSGGTKSTASDKSTGPGKANATTSGNSMAANANTPATAGGASDKTSSTSNADTAASRKTTAAKAPTANDAPPAGSHFVVQIGSFSTDAPAQAWVTRLKAAGVPAYVQHSRQDDGSTRVLVRAGPFADRAAAETAVRKVRSVDAPEDAGASAATQ